MSSRTVLLCAALLTTACRGEPRGPERSLDGAFSYSTALTAGRTLALRNMAGSINIEPAADDTLRVVADLTWRGEAQPPRAISFRGDTMPGGVLVCAVFGEGRCDVEDYTGKSDGGLSIGSRGLRLSLGGADDANVHFRVQVPAGVRLDLVLVDGAIVSASSGPVRARGVNGDITIVTSVGPVQAKTVNGSVDARMTTLGGGDSVQVETVNGDAAAYLPESAAVTVEARTTNGSASSDFAGLIGSTERLNRGFAGTLGAGTTPVRVRSINGSVQVRRLDASGRPFEFTPTP